MPLKPSQPVFELTNRLEDDEHEREVHDGRIDRYGQVSVYTITTPHVAHHDFFSGDFIT